MAEPFQFLACGVPHHIVKRIHGELHDVLEAGGDRLRLAQQDADDYGRDGKEGHHEPCVEDGFGNPDLHPANIENP
jgi:hypothetical protein